MIECDGITTRHTGARSVVESVRRCAAFTPACLFLPCLVALNSRIITSFLYEHAAKGTPSQTGAAAIALHAASRSVCRSVVLRRLAQATFCWPPSESLRRLYSLHQLLWT